MHPAAPSASSLSPPAVMRSARSGALSPADPDAVLARQVLQQLFNGPDTWRGTGTALRTPNAAVAALFARIVTGRDFSTVHEDQAALLAVLRDGVARGPFDPTCRLTSCSIGKALHVLCQLWRNRCTLHYDRTSLVRAAELCVTLIERQPRFLLETCSVLMFHLGELLACEPLRGQCAQLICDHLEPKFRADLEQRLGIRLAGVDVAFGLISTLRASEAQLGTEDGATQPRTAADRLLKTVQELLARQPGFLATCESATLGLIARHGVHYLRRVAAVQARHDAGPHGPQRQYRVARLIKACIDEVCTPGPRAADASGARPPPGFGGHLRYATPYYLGWLARQEPHVQTQLALRAPAMADALPCPPAEGHQEAIARISAAMVGVQLGWTTLDLGGRARLLLDVDAVYRRLEQDNPMQTQRYSAALEDMGGFMAAQLSQLVDAHGQPLLGPAPPSSGGLQSWQRMLLTRLLE